MSKRKARADEYHPVGWQLDPERVQTETVQYWKGRSMLTAQMTRDHARQLVRERMAFVITSQAIGAMDERGVAVD